MTREEAIKNLNALYPLTCKMVDGRYKGGFKDTESPVGQTISTAIRSLEAWDKVIEVISKTLDTEKDTGIRTGYVIAEKIIKDHLPELEGDKTNGS